jgi:hypothetical protein
LQVVGLPLFADVAVYTWEVAAIVATDVHIAMSDTGYLCKVFRSVKKMWLAVCLSRVLIDQVQRVCMPYTARTTTGADVSTPLLYVLPTASYSDSDERDA